MLNKQTLLKYINICLTWNWFKHNNINTTLV